jgi:mRNA-degrading endonuclease toxin of MazEF toxin-antitoxin module
VPFARWAEAWFGWSSHVAAAWATGCGWTPAAPAAPGNVVLAAARAGLPKDSVANVSQIVSVDRSVLSDRVGNLPENDLRLILAGIDLVFGRE